MAGLECAELVTKQYKEKEKWQNILESGLGTSRHLLPPSLPSSFSPPPFFSPLILVFLP